MSSPPSATQHRRSGWGVRIGLGVFSLVFLGGWVGLQWLNGVLTALDRPASAVAAYKVITIEPGESPRQIATALWDHGLIRDRRLFVRYARWRGVDDQLKFGEYRLNTSLNTREVVDRLAAGNVLTHRFTVREGATKRDIARELESLGLASAEDILALTEDETFLSQFGIPTGNAEGYLFPETYHVARGVPPEHLVELMLLEYQARTRPLTDDIATANYTPYELLTIASVIEKEALLESDMPLVSAVVHNRLEKDMLLQCDVTIRYELDNYGQHLTRADLKIDSPYNSYKYKGLPPTPICNPGDAALRAAVRPAKADYLYFVSMNNGAHIFSRTYAEHKSHVRRYQIENERGTTVPSAAPHEQSPRPGDPPAPATEVLPVQEAQLDAPTAPVELAHAPAAD